LSLGAVQDDELSTGNLEEERCVFDNAQGTVSKGAERDFTPSKTALGDQLSASAEKRVLQDERTGMKGASQGGQSMEGEPSAHGAIQSIGAEGFHDKRTYRKGTRGAVMGPICEQAVMVKQIPGGV